MNDQTQRLGADSERGLRQLVNDEEWLRSVRSRGEASWFETELRIAARRQAFGEIRSAYEGWLERRRVRPDLNCRSDERTGIVSRGVASVLSQFRRLMPDPS